MLTEKEKVVAAAQQGAANTNVFEKIVAAAQQGAANTNVFKKIEHGVEELYEKCKGEISFGKKVIAAVKEAKTEEPQAEAQLEKFLDDFKSIAPTLAGALTAKGLNFADDSAAYAGFKTLLADGEALAATAGVVIHDVEAAA